MARNRVHGGERIKVVATATHSSGDLVWEKGFYGIVQDDCVSGDLITLILNSVWNLRNVPSTVGMGRTLAAPATALATTLPLGLVPSVFLNATTGWNVVGRTIETGTATTAKVQLFPYRPAAF